MFVTNTFAEALDDQLAERLGELASVRARLDLVGKSNELLDEEPRNNHVARN